MAHEIIKPRFEPSRVNFEMNVNQMSEFKARGNGGYLFLISDGKRLALSSYMSSN